MKTLTHHPLHKHQSQPSSKPGRNAESLAAGIAPTSPAACRELCAYSPAAIAGLLLVAQVFIAGPLFAATTPAPSAIVEANPVRLVSSDFNDPLIGKDNWVGTNQFAGSEELTWHSGTGAGPSIGGFVSIGDSGSKGGIRYFAAPARFLGDKSPTYNGELRFDLRQAATTKLLAAGEVLIAGNGLTLVIPFSLPASGDWSNIVVPLSKDAGWLVAGQGRRAEPADLASVLAAMDKLLIGTEYGQYKASRVDFDNVSIWVQPTGSLQPSLTVNIYAGLTVVGQVGASYAIEYRTALGNSADWQTLTELVLPVSPFIFVDQTAPAVGTKFYRAVLKP